MGERDLELLIFLRKCECSKEPRPGFSGERSPSEVHTLAQLEKDVARQRAWNQSTGNPWVAGRCEWGLDASVGGGGSASGARKRRGG